MQQSIKEFIIKWPDSLNIEQLKNNLNKVIGDLNKIRKSADHKSNKLLLKKKYKMVLASITKKPWYSETKATINLIKKTSQGFEKAFTKSNITKPKKKPDFKKGGLRSNSTVNGKPKVKKSKS